MSEIEQAMAEVVAAKAAYKSAGRRQARLNKASDEVFRMDNGVTFSEFIAAEFAMKRAVAAYNKLARAARAAAA